MEAILILAHGSRAEETENTLNAVVDMVREKLPEKLIKIAYMEFGKVNIESGLDELIKQGANEIKVVPYFLFDGIHIQEDIPNELKVYREKNVGVNITLGKTLGVDKRLAEILVDRINS